MIHPSAVIDPRAELAANVSVAPYSVIGPDVRIGDGTEIGAHVVLEGRVAIGARCRIGHGAVIGGVPQDFKYREGIPVGVRIGDETVIREHVTIHRATREGMDTRVGDHCLVMATSHIAHDCAVGNHVILINYAGLTGHVVVEDRATVGADRRRPLRSHRRVRLRRRLLEGEQGHPAVRDGGGHARHRARRQRDRHAPRRDRCGLAPGGAVRVPHPVPLRPGARHGVAARQGELGQHPLVAQLIAFIEASKLGVISRDRRRGPAEIEETIL